MRGSITRKQTAKGVRYAAVVDIGQHSDGKRQREQVGIFTTKRAAEEKLTEVLGQQAQGTHIPRTKLTTGAWLEEWLELRKPGPGKKLKRSTHAGYSMVLRIYVEPELGRIPLRDLTGVRLASLFNKLLTVGVAGSKGRLSPRSLRNVRMVVKRALADAVKQGKISANPAERTDPITIGTVSEMKTWSGAQLGQFLNFVEQHDPHYYLPLMVAAHTGLRRAELLALKWEDLEDGVLYVKRSLVSVGGKVFFDSPKTKRASRSLDLDHTVLETLRVHRLAQRELGSRVPGYNPDGLMFTAENGSLLLPDSFTAHFSRLARKAGLPRIRLHDLRHSAASLMYANNVPIKVISEMLGHSTVSFTMDTYVHAASEQKRAAASTLAAAIAR